jgi:hypothetical protein
VLSSLIFYLITPSMSVIKILDLDFWKYGTLGFDSTLVLMFCFWNLCRSSSGNIFRSKLWPPTSPGWKQLGMFVSTVGLSVSYTAKVLQKLFFNNWILIIITIPLIHFFLCRKLHCWVGHWLEQLWHLQSLTHAMIEWCVELLQEVQLPQLQLLFATSLIKTCHCDNMWWSLRKGLQEIRILVDEDGPLCLANNNSCF